MFNLLAIDARNLHSILLKSSFFDEYQITFQIFKSQFASLSPAPRTTIQNRSHRPEQEPESVTALFALHRQSKAAHTCHISLNSLGTVYAVASLSGAGGAGRNG
jgi:hypothetical protein